MFGADLLNYDFGIFYVFRYYNITSITLCCRTQQYGIIHTISNLYTNACFYEREISEFFGIRFLFNYDMRNLFLPYNYRYYPLRKNFRSNSVESLFMNRNGFISY